MRSKALMPAIYGLVALIAILVAVVLWLVPASNDLSDQLVHARGEIPRYRSQLPALVGPSFGGDLTEAIEQGKLQGGVLAKELTQQARELARWFPPARNRFGSAYTFHQDEIRRLLTEVAHIQRRKLTEVPLISPKFLAEGRDPVDVDEMLAAQRIANLESVLLRAASKAGGFPTKPIEFTEGWSVGEGSPFQESSVVLHLSLAAGNLPAVLRSLCELKGEGPIIRLEQLSTRPRPLPERMEATDVPLIEADVRLIVSTYRK